MVVRNRLRKGHTKAIAAALEGNTALKSIDIGYSNIARDEALQLVELFKEKQMVSYGIGGCNLGDDGAQAAAGDISSTTSR